MAPPMSRSILPTVLPKDFLGRSWVSSIRGSELENLRVKLEVPRSMTFRLLSEGECTIHELGVHRDVYLYLEMFNADLRLPFPLPVREVLSGFNLAPSQLRPNAWRILIACCILWPMVLEKGCHSDNNLTSREFMYYYRLETKDGGVYNFGSRPRRKVIELEGFGCDTATVINILAHRDATQRALIQQEYRTMYSGDLNKRLSSELSGNVKRAVSLWIHDLAARDATIVRQALSGDFIDLKAATEVICSRTSSQIQQFKQVYFAIFGIYLEDDIEYQASGDHKKLMLAYISTPRYEGLEFDKLMVEKDANALYKAGEKRLGTDEKTFIHIFSERSRAHLAAVDSAYNDIYGNSLKKAVKKETSGYFENALLTILQCAQNPGKYFAKVLHKAMKGLGTDDSTLIRIIVTRAEIDMQYIKVEYQKKYGKTLNDDVHSETSGHYRAFLLSLLGPSL